MPETVDSPHQNYVLRDDLWTVAAMGAIAYMAANVAHETIGHGVGFLLAGGRSGILTTTRMISPVHLPDPAWRIFDMGGPAGNLICAGCGWTGVRLLPAQQTGGRLFCWLLMAFSLFWAFGYLLFSGVAGRGDWLALLPDGMGLGRVLFVIAGILLYALSMRLAARELEQILDGPGVHVARRAKRLTGIAWLAGGIVATAGAALDPRGAREMINSGAMSSFGLAVGMLRLPRYLTATPAASNAKGGTIARSAGWIVAALILAILFVVVLGRGIPWKI